MQDAGLQTCSSCHILPAFLSPVKPDLQFRRTAVPSSEIAAVLPRVYDRAAIHPGDKSFDFPVRQPAIVGELPMRGIGKPWRHLADQHRLLNGLGPWPRVLVGQ